MNLLLRMRGEEKHMKKATRIVPLIKKPGLCQMNDGATKNIVQNPYNLPGFEKFTQENAQIKVCDEDGSVYCLAVTYSVSEENVFWVAREEIGEDPNSGYEFSISTNVLEDQFYAYSRLVNKVRSGIRKKTLKVISERADNSLKRNGKQYKIKEKGVIRIAFMGDGKYGFIIDGILVCPEEFALMLSTYEGFDLVFSIVDSCD